MIIWKSSRILLNKMSIAGVAIVISYLGIPMVGLERYGLFVKNGKSHSFELMSKSNSGAGWKSQRSEHTKPA